MTIGDLADRAGVSVRTIRYWTDRGLIEAGRMENNYRVYPEESVETVRFIRAAQGLGLSIEEISSILALQADGVRPCEHVRDRLASHLQRVRHQIDELRTLESTIEERLRWAESHPQVSCEGPGCVYVSGAGSR